MRVAAPVVPAAETAVAAEAAVGAMEAALRMVAERREKSVCQRRGAERVSSEKEVGGDAYAAYRI